MNDYYQSNSTIQPDQDQQNTISQLPEPSIQTQGPSEFTEVFSWGNDRQGQLGLGKQVQNQKQFHMIPRFCSYNIAITQIACGASHSVFITSNGEVYSWGINENGQCGTGGSPYQSMVQWGPKLVKFDDYQRPNIKQINCGANHSGFIDEIGRLFMCGRGDYGQLGNQSYADESVPYFVAKIPEKIQEVACGEDHTVILTRNGEIYTMGNNQRGQLGIGPPTRGSNIPILLQELSFIKMMKIRAGSFSASLSTDYQLYLWGCGTFGEFYTPHRVKSVTQLDLADFELGRSGFLAVLTRQGQVYTWGVNETGQLGQRDCIQRSTPHRVEALDGKRVTQIAAGRDFVIALGLTLPQKELENIAKKKNALKESSGSRGRHPNRDYDSSNSESMKKSNSKSKNHNRQSSKSASKSNNLNYSSIQQKSSERKPFRGSNADPSSSIPIYSQQQPQNTAEPLNYTPLRSSPKRENSGQKSKSSIGKRKSGSKIPQQENSIEQYKLQQSIIQEQVVNNLRREKDSLQLALSSELHNRRTLESENDQLKSQLLQQEKELRDIQVARERLEENLRTVDQKHSLDYQNINHSNNRLAQENEDLKLRMYEQEQLLKKFRLENEDLLKKYDYQSQEVKQLSQDLLQERKISEDQKRELYHNIDLRKKSENELTELVDEVERFKASFEDKRAGDIQEIQSLQAQLKDLKYNNDELYRKFAMKQEEAAQLNQDVLGWKDVLDRLNNENTDLKQVIEDLEQKNRKLVEKLNEQIYQKATEYKEKTLQALTRSDSPTKLRRALGGQNPPKSDLRLNQVLQDENQPPYIERSSPLKPLNNQENNRGFTTYMVRKDLDKLEDQKTSVTPKQASQSNGFNLLTSQQDYSPLRRKEVSPLKESQQQFANQSIGFQNFQNPGRTREEQIDDNYRKVRESCERIANVLGLNTAATMAQPQRQQNPSATGTNQMRTPTEFLSPDRKADQSSASFMFNPSFGQPSPITNANKDSKGAQSATSMASVIFNIMQQLFQQSMVRQSLHELRQKLDQMKREKDAVENSLSAYEERKGYQ